MSYDLRLYRKDKLKEPLSENKLESLNNKFKIVITEKDDQNRVLGFYAKYTDNNPEWLTDDGFEFYYQDKGYYFTYIAYSASEEMFEYFKKLTRDIALALNFQIQDTQMSEHIIDPNEYETFQPTENSFGFTQKILQGLANSNFLDYVTPSTFKYFIKYFLIAVEPNTEKRKMLLLEGNKMYCSKVNVGESLCEVINKEIELLTGSKLYQITNVLHGDFDYDRHGNKIPRYNVFLQIPYFNPYKIKLKFNMKWRNLEHS